MALRAMLSGIRRVASAPFLVLLLWSINVLVALPAAGMIADALERSIGSSQVHEKLRKGFDVEWFGEFDADARGLEKTFRPEQVVGAGGFYSNLESWLSGTLFTARPILVVVGVVYAVVWLLLLGGVLARYAHRGAGPRPRVFRSAATFFFRFLRLAMVSGVLYLLVFRMSWWLLDRVGEATRDVPVEGVVFNYSLLVWALTAFLLMLIHMSFGYAKIATVVENRRSMLLAALRGIGFVLFHPGKSLGVYYGVLLVSALLLAVYSFVAPGVGQASVAGVAWAFAVAQLFLLAKLLARLWLFGSQVALYQAVMPSGEATAEESSRE